MSIFITIVTALMLSAANAASWPHVVKTSADAPAVPARATAEPVQVKRKFLVQAGKQVEFTFESPAGKSPALHGHWSCRGSSAGITGAKDDTLVAFVLRGPDDKVIEKRDHPTSGNFTCRFAEPGAFTFVFINTGIVRSSDRLIILEGTYDAD